MLKIISPIVVAVCLLIITARSYARAVLYSDCENNIQVPQEIVGSYSGGYFDQDCTTFYVLPPLIGQLELSSWSFPFKGICSRYLDRRDSKKRIWDLQRNQLERNLQRCTTVGTEIEELVLLRNDVRQKNISLESEISEIQGNVENCISNPPSSSEGTALCGIYAGKLSGKQKELSLEQGRFDGLVDDIKRLGDVENYCNGPDSLSSAEKLLELDVDEVEFYLDWNRKIAGSMVGLVISFDQQKIIEELRAANGDQYNFLAVPVQGGLSMAFSADSSQERIQSVTAVNIPGFPVKALSSNAILGGAIGSSPQVGDAIALAGALSGSMELSFPASCEIEDLAGEEEIQTVLDANAKGTYTYFYPVNAGSEFTVKVELRKLVERIIERSTKGGLFRTRSSLKESHNAFSSELVKVEFTEDLPDILKQDLVDAARDRAIERALALLNGSFANIEFKQSLPGDPQTGASVAADGIASSGCASKWCVVAVVALKVANAIFSDQSARHEFLMNIEASVTEEYSKSKTFILYRTSGLRVEQ